jgi:glycosyltransferase involved in cell wall biosynthesis
MSDVPHVSVVVPAYNAHTTLDDCLRALTTQSLPREQFEVIVVDDGSTDDTVARARTFGVRVVQQVNAGAASARNAGWRTARGRWIAFTDADCVPARGWLKALLAAVREEPGRPMPLGAAGATLGLASMTPAARFVDVTGGLDAQRHLAHPRFPFAPSGNMMYRRDALAAVNGFDERYRTYEACDLHGRLIRVDAGRFTFAPPALVLHRHRASWRAYWRQQVSYGFGLGQFTHHRSDEIRWSIGHEFGAWAATAAAGVRAVLPASGDERLARRGTFVKQLAQRIGFCSFYWNPTERVHW